MSANVLVGLCGAWGLAGSLTWSFARTRRAMLVVQISSAPGFILHWALQEHWTAAGLTVLTMLLALISAALDGPPNSRSVRIARALYLVALLPIAALTAWSWQGWHSLFAALGTAIACYGRWQTDKARFRALILACSVPWFAHNLAVGSVPAMAFDLFLMARGAWLALRGRVPAARMAAVPAS
jgi:hypothetical protein